MKLKVLWITVGILPPVEERLSRIKHVKGGWVYAALVQLRSIYPMVEFAVATLDKRRDLFHEKIDGVDYWLLPERNRRSYDKQLEKYWVDIRNEFNPDVVHIHGTEQPHGLAYLNACGSRNVVASLQGLVHVISRHYLDGISFWELFQSVTISDLMHFRLLWMRKMAFFFRGKLEEISLKKLENVMGRTSWDLAHVRAINPKVCYFREERTLRPEFYSGRWSYGNCTPYSIFLSQVGYPVKGFHFLIKALAYVVREFPETIVFLGGEKILNCRTGYLGGYGKLCSRLIKSRGLEGRFHFLGSLSAEKMKVQYLNANVFVSPSTIENSPNSVCEAQILGVPIVASDVGGVVDFIEHGKTGFVYRSGDAELLAHWICHVFRQKESMNEYSERMHQVASKRHDKIRNAEALMDIYKRIAMRG